jgi:hypothetical protein
MGDVGSELAQRPERVLRVAEELGQCCPEPGLAPATLVCLRPAFRGRPTLLALCGLLEPPHAGVELGQAVVRLLRKGRMAVGGQARTTQLVEGARVVTTGRGRLPLRLGLPGRARGEMGREHVPGPAAEACVCRGDRVSRRAWVVGCGCLRHVGHQPAAVRGVHGLPGDLLAAAGDPARTDKPVGRLGGFRKLLQEMRHPLGHRGGLKRLGQPLTLSYGGGEGVLRLRKRACLPRSGPSAVGRTSPAAPFRSAPSRTGGRAPEPGSRSFCRLLHSEPPLLLAGSAWHGRAGSEAWFPPPLPEGPASVTPASSSSTSSSASAPPTRAPGFALAGPPAELALPLCSAHPEVECISLTMAKVFALTSFDLDSSWVRLSRSTSPCLTWQARPGPSGSQGRGERGRGERGRAATGLRTHVLLLGQLLGAVEPLQVCLLDLAAQAGPLRKSGKGGKRKGGKGREGQAAQARLAKRAKPGGPAGRFGLAGPAKGPAGRSRASDPCALRTAPRRG